MENNNMDLFEAQVQTAVEARLKEELSKIVSDPYMVIEAYHKQNKILENRIAEKEKEVAQYQDKAVKFTKFLDADGYLDVSEVAEKIRVPYIDPQGKKQIMGRTYFCKLLSYDRILLQKSSGYGLYADCSKTLRDNSKTVSAERNGYITSSVKFNAKALEWLDDKYSRDARVWHSTGERDIYYE